MVKKSTYDKSFKDKNSTHDTSLKAKNSTYDTPLKARNLHIEALGFCFLIFVLSRYFFFVEYSFITNTLLHLVDQSSKFIENMYRWDSGNYANIALNGYDASYHLGGNYVWLPLWPIILKAISLNGIIPIREVAFFLNQTMLFGSLLIFYHYLHQLKFERNSIQFGIILVAFAPTNIYFFSGLTEPLFLLLSLIAFYSLEKDKIWLAVLCAALMSITKIVGIMFLFPLVYYHYKQNRLNLKLIVQCICIAIPLITYMVYLQLHVGDYLAFIHAQKAPGFARPGLDFNQDIVSQILQMFQAGTIYDTSAFLISMFLITYVLWRKKLHGQAIFNFMCVLPILVSGGTWNSFRMCFAVFTAYLSAVVLSDSSMVLKLFIMIISTAMTMVCLIFWLSGSWVFA